MICYNENCQSYPCPLYYKIRPADTKCKITLKNSTRDGYKIII